MSRVALFDLDGTLIRLPSSERRFIGELWSRRLLNWRRATLFALYLPVWLPRFGRDVARKNKAYLSGLEIGQVESLGRDFARHLAAEVTSPMRQALEDHQESGDYTVLLTGSPYFIAQPLGRLLGFDEVIATQPARAGSRFSWLPPTQHPLGREKLTLAQAVCNRQQKPLSEAAAYGDSRQDVALLSEVGQPVAVCPDDSLRQVAQEDGWTILMADQTSGYSQRLRRK